MQHHEREVQALILQLELGTITVDEIIEEARDACRACGIEHEPAAA